MIHYLYNLAIYIREMKICAHTRTYTQDAHSNFAYDAQQLGTTKMSLNKRMAQETAAQPFHGIALSSAHWDT